MKSKKKLKIKSVIFDMDGVITNTMPDHFRAWYSVLLKEGIHATHEDIYSREGQRGLQSVREIFKKYNKRYSFKEAKKILAKKENLFKKMTKMRFVTGSRTFINRLYKKGIMLALVTGTSRHELKRILPESIYRLFRVTITGNDVKRGKPHPEPFQKALRKLNIDAREAVAIENAPFGIKSAKEAGLKVLALETSLSRKHLKEADCIFKSIKELEQSIQFSNHV